MKKSGFTLVELLVVVSIISLLALAGLAVYITFIKAARDSKRQSDLKFIQSALEQFHADQKFYPVRGTSCSNNGQLVIGCSLKDPAGSKTYLTLVPSDPSPSNPQYLYEAKVGANPVCDNISVNCNNYCLWTKLENPKAVQLTTNCPSFPAGYNFLVTPP
ncbi:type II secretion system protein [Candidatus Microgenomates bacterium]|nr:type II secretion system protein [Candidatus Microgenomates bacterium]